MVEPGKLQAGIYIYQVFKGSQNGFNSIVQGKIVKN